MDGAMRVKIHFHQQDEASIFLESNAIGDDQQRHELLFFSCFTATQLVHLANDMRGSSSLAKALSKLELPWAPVDDDLKAFTASILSKAPDTPKLVDYKGSPCKKRFEAELRISFPNKGKIKVNLELQSKGFGLWGRGTTYYIPHSVLLLFEYLARRRIQDGDYLYKLAEVAASCGKIYLNGKLSAENHLSQALTIFQMAEKETELFGPSWARIPVLGSERIGYLALMGVPSAQYQVGVMYHKGEGRPQDYKRAADHFRKAAKQGFAPAKYMLGWMYAMGQGVEQSTVEGIKWITEAALEGLVGAQVTLGQMYSTGFGVSLNLKEALKWYEMAAKQGNEEAKKRLSEMGSSI
jgi:hypothetical protein